MTCTQHHVHYCGLQVGLLTESIPVSLSRSCQLASAVITEDNIIGVVYGQAESKWSRQERTQDLFKGGGLPGLSTWIDMEGGGG